MKRHLLCVALVASMPPMAVSAAPSTTPGFTPFDQKQFAKLGTIVGTWNCIDTPASKKPDVIVITQEGNYYVSRETGDEPNTSYVRWGRLLKRYYNVTVYDSGATDVYETTSMDPYNATWTAAWPQLSGNNRLSPYTLTYSDNTVTASSSELNEKGQMVTGKSVCTKQ